MRRIGTCGLMIAGFVLIAAPALAHVEVSPTELPESSEQELLFSYQHGCDGLATDGLEVLLPEGVEVNSIGGPEGWQSTIEETDDGQVIVWSGPAVPDGVEAEYPVELDLPAGAGTTLYFPTIQRCGPDNQVRWIEIPAEGQDPEELAEPAPAVLLVDNPDATTTTTTRDRDDDGGDNDHRRNDNVGRGDLRQHRAAYHCRPGYHRSGCEHHRCGRSDDIAISTDHCRLVR